MQKIHLNDCPVCQQSATSPFLNCTDHYATGETYKIVRCEHCGFLFTQDFPDESEIGKYYESSDYVSHSDTRKGAMNKVYHLVRSYMLRKKARMVEQVSGVRKGRILDIGCGTGYFLNTMHTRGWQTLGVEKNRGAAKAAAEHFGLNVLSDLKEVPENGKFNVITLWHVLEHLQDLSGTFARLRQLLAENGTLVIALPNSASYDANHYQAYWGAFDVPRHLWHFSPDTFGRLAAREGFRIEKFAPMPFDAFYVSMLSEKYKGNNLPFLRGMMRGTLALAKALPDPVQSSSIIYVLKKR